MMFQSPHLFGPVDLTKLRVAALIRSVAFGSTTAKRQSEREQKNKSSENFPITHVLPNAMFGLKAVKCFPATLDEPYPIGTNPEIVWLCVGGCVGFCSRLFTEFGVFQRSERKSDQSEFRQQKWA